MKQIGAIFDSCRKQGSRWRDLAAGLFFVLGLMSVLWGSHNLLIQTEVPNCTISVNEATGEGGSIENSGSVLGQNGLGQIQVEILGAVVQPGIYWLNFESRLTDAINLAGGLSKDVDKQKLNSQLNLAQKLKDEQKIKIPIKQEVELDDWLAEYCSMQGDLSTSNNQSMSDAQNEDYSESQESSKKMSSECISINYASSIQLQTLAGVGEKTAQLIIDGRPYLKINDLLNVKGIGDSTLEKLEPLICL